MEKLHCYFNQNPDKITNTKLNPRLPDFCHTQSKANHWLIITLGKVMDPHVSDKIHFAYVTHAFNTLAMQQLLIIVSEIDRTRRIVSLKMSITLFRQSSAQGLSLYWL